MIARRKREPENLLQKGLILCEGGSYLICSAEERKDIDDAEKKFKRENPETPLQMRLYKVVIDYCKETNTIKGWRPEQGFSLWASCMPKKL